MIYRVDFSDGTYCHTGYGPLAHVWAKRKGSKITEIEMSNTIYVEHDAAAIGRTYKDGLIDAIYLAQRERELSEIAFSSKEFASAYKLAASNLIVMLIDEICIQCPGESLIELQTRFMGNPNE